MCNFKISSYMLILLFKIVKKQEVQSYKGPNQNHLSFG